MAMPLGALISFLLPNIFFDSVAVMQEKELEFYILIQSILVTMLSVPSMIFLREEPPTPPTYVVQYSI